MLTILSRSYFKNKTTDDALKIERESTTGEFSEVFPYVNGKRGREVFINGKELRAWKELSAVSTQFTRCFEIGSISAFLSFANFVDYTGDPDYGVWTAGLCIGLIKDIPTCEELVARIEKEALETISKQLSYVKDRARL